ncbi:SulP family inorganic anion transporter [Nocardia inohanensis]|uniref:SulP family inorganic anion transporter n=1 Tax=Nocardia inohanensis TaxID=209246 RepID=UPI00082AED17|nr:SulP family inorganic anion transporter [Nocardia inohanensis]
MKNPLAQQYSNSAPAGRGWIAETAAGFGRAAAAVPDGLAAGVLAGVGPVQGLYAGVAGPLFGGLRTGTALMAVSATAASASAAGAALANVPAADRRAAAALLSVLVGGVLILAGRMHFGRCRAWISHAAVSGVLLGVAVNIALGILPGLTGNPLPGIGTPIAHAITLPAHERRLDIASIVLGLTALLLLTTLARKGFPRAAAPVALIVPTLLTVLPGMGAVHRVGELGGIPRGMPMPHLPDPARASWNLLSGAAAVAVIVLVQGLGAAESLPGRNGLRRNADRDLAAEGIGNLAAGVLGGVPVGGVSARDGRNSAGGRTRWAIVSSGLWMLVLVTVLAPLAGLLTVPALAAVLFAVATGVVRVAEPGQVWRGGAGPRIVLITTLAATLVLPLAWAVAVAVGQSVLSRFDRAGLDARVRTLVVVPESTARESISASVARLETPGRLPEGVPVVLEIRGSVRYGGAHTVASRLPEPAATGGPDVVLRLCDGTACSAALLGIIADYTVRLAVSGGRLYLDGFDPGAADSWPDAALARHGLRLDHFPGGWTPAPRWPAGYAPVLVRPIIIATNGA